jgi:catechol 2,3-dioxygenase-like lactoylglutathione lyase family enzyme
VSNARLANHTFTKLVVDDLEAMTRYYGAVYGLSELMRFKAEIDGSPIDEIVLGVDGASTGLILLTFLDRAAPPNGEVIVGFTTDDVHALFERGIAAGGTVRGEIHDPGVQGAALVGFLADPEGHLAEVVQTP